MGIIDFSVERFADLIAKSPTEFGVLDPRLSIESSGEFEVFYAPFEHINPNARISIVGLTPGQSQMAIALSETRKSLQQGVPWLTAIERAKYRASFGGPLRGNLVRMLDHIELNRWLDIESCSLLFSENRMLAHHTSILRYPTMKGRKNYSGQPPIVRSAFLQAHLDKWFADEISQLDQSVFVPLGSEVQSVFQALVGRGLVGSERVLFGLPHPSGANAERISYFLKNKAKEDLSRQTNPIEIDKMRLNLIHKVKDLKI